VSVCFGSAFGVVVCAVFGFQRGVGGGSSSVFGFLGFPGGASRVWGGGTGWGGLWGFGGGWGLGVGFDRLALGGGVLVLFWGVRGEGG